MKTYSLPPQVCPAHEMVLAKACLRAAKLLSLNDSGLAQVLGLSEASISSIQSGRRGLDLSSREGELAMLLIHLFAVLDTLVGNDGRRRHMWF